MKLDARFFEILSGVQGYISKNYSTTISDSSKFKLLKGYIHKYLNDNGIETSDGLVNAIYSEMVEYSIITPYLGNEDVEEINVNAWDDVAITYRNGEIIKLEQGFGSPKHAIDIVKRLLHHSNMILDNATPMAQGHLPNNTRITALMHPLVDEDAGISISIRLLHSSEITTGMLASTGHSTPKMLEFLCTCLRYGVSFVIAGATSSGKTTLLNALLESIPNNKRIFTIESGARELSLVRRSNGKVINNVVHTLSKISDDENLAVSQEDLVVASLRFNPDIIVVGEMRDVEAYSAVEASLTGHTVVSTIHAHAADYAYMRLALLCQKRFPIEFKTSLMQAAQAFPIVAYVHRLDDNSRRLMNISECEVGMDGEMRYRTLFRYVIDKNEIKGDNIEISGHFEQVSEISDSLRKRLTQSGAPNSLLQKFKKEEEKSEVKDRNTTLEKRADDR